MKRKSERNIGRNSDRTRSAIVEFFRLWGAGYLTPRRMFGGIGAAKGPGIGLAATLVRGLLIGLLSYLPAYLAGKLPTPPGPFTFIPQESYFLFLSAFSPVYFLITWLAYNALTYLILRLLKYEISFDMLLNLSGMVALVVGSFIILQDWIWILVGLKSVIILGISHLVIDVWAVTLIVVGMKKLMKIPVWLGIVLNIVVWIAAVPVAMFLMRAPM